MHWNTCPPFSSKPQHRMLNQNWEVIPIVSEENKSYYNGQIRLQKKLDKEKTDCSWPSHISEIVHLKKTTKINIQKMEQYSNPSFRGISFKGLTNISGKKYVVYYRGRLEKTDDLLGYNFDDFFDTCEISNK